MKATCQPAGCRGRSSERVQPHVLLLILRPQPARVPKALPRPHGDPPGPWENPQWVGIVTPTGDMGGFLSSPAVWLMM